MSDLVALFGGLPKPDQSGDGGLRFESVPVPNSPSFYLGKTSSGDAALLIDVADVDTSSLPPMRLELLTVYHRALCKISVGKHEEERIFTVIWHNDGTTESRNLFLGILTPAVASLGEKPSASKIASIIDVLARMFRALSQPARKTTQGLWAELLLIALASDPVAMARAWHVHTDDRFDFNAGLQRVEVKSAGVAARRHHFSFEQLHPPHGSEVVIASLMVSRATAGTSLRALMERALDCLAGFAALQTNIYEIVADTLGRDLATGLEESYDEQLGATSLWFLRHDQVPCVDAPLPLHVSEVRFVSDLTGITPLSHAELLSKGGLFSALPLVHSV